MPTLITWINQFKSDVLSVSKEPTTSESESLNPTAAKQLKEILAKLLEDNRSLTKKIALLEEERLILKKAAAYFAKEQR